MEQINNPYFIEALFKLLSNVQRKPASPLIHYGIVLEVKN